MMRGQVGVERVEADVAVAQIMCGGVELGSGWGGACCCSGFSGWFVCGGLCWSVQSPLLTLHFIQSFKQRHTGPAIATHSLQDEMKFTRNKKQLQ